MLNGKLLEKNALSGSIQTRTIYAGGGDAPIKSISVDGVEVEPDSNKNVNIDLSGKVDKVTDETTNPQVYAKDKDGTQTMLNAVQYYHEDRNGLARFINGNLIVNTPTEDAHATHKKYVDGNFVKSTSEAKKIYGTDENGSSVEYNLVSNTYTANSIVQRSATGTIATADPQWGNDATNKRYVDTKIADLVNSAPETLDTIGEVAEALKTNAEVVDALNSAISNKLDKQTPEFDAGATRGYVYFIDPEQKQTVKKVQIQANADTIPLRNPSGNFYVGQPTLPYECANLGTVTAKQGTEAPTESTVALFVGQIYQDTTNNTTYQCTAIDTTNKVYTWVKLIRETDDPTTEKGGVVRISTLNYGLEFVPSQHTFRVKGLTDSKIENRQDFSYEAVTLAKFDKTLKASMTDNKETWTDDDKKSARALIGATNLNTHANYGVQNNNSGLVMVVKATDDEITNRSTAYKPIVPANLDCAIVQGLTNNSITLTEEQKTAVQNWLGLGDINTALETILGV